MEASARPVTSGRDSTIRGLERLCERWKFGVTLLGPAAPPA